MTENLLYLQGAQLGPQNTSQLPSTQALRTSTPRLSPPFQPLVLPQSPQVCSAPPPRSFPPTHSPRHSARPAIPPHCKQPHIPQPAICFPTWSHPSRRKRRAALPDASLRSQPSLIPQHPTWSQGSPPGFGLDCLPV